MNSEKLEKYSILMSVYKNDNPDYLRIAIESMLSQTAPPEQFVVIEDGPVSTQIEDVIRYFEHENQKLFTVVRLSVNGGLGYALNQGLMVCRNELVARMDADDISLPERCKKQLERFKQNPELSILGTQIKEFIGNPENIVSMRKVPCSYNEIVEFAKRRSPFNHPTVMFKKTTVEKLGGYPCLNRKEDLALFVNAATSGVILENLEDVLLLYRANDNNLRRRKAWVNCKEYIEVMYGYYRNKKIGVLDMLYVLLGQLSMFLLPDSLSKQLSKVFLRNKVDN